MGCRKWKRPKGINKMDFLKEMYKVRPNRNKVHLVNNW